MADRELTLALLEVVRERMDEQGLSGRALARRLDTGVTATAALLKGETEVSVDRADAIAVALGMAGLEELLEHARRLL